MASSETEAMVGRIMTASMTLAARELKNETFVPKSGRRMSSEMKVRAKYA